jgi:hypothetical protein
MRNSLAIATLGVAALIASGAAAASAPATKDAALAAGNWRRAAELGASAADVVRALQARGEFRELVPDESVVTIGPDNRVEAVALPPLPPLPSDAAGPNARTRWLSGSGFAFGAARGSTILYPAFAGSFAGPPAAR